MRHAMLLLRRRFRALLTCRYADYVISSVRHAAYYYYYYFAAAADTLIRLIIMPIFR